MCRLSLKKSFTYISVQMWAIIVDVRSWKCDRVSLLYQISSRTHLPPQILSNWEITVENPGWSHWIPGPSPWRLRRINVSATWIRGTETNPQATQPVSTLPFTTIFSMIWILTAKCNIELTSASLSLVPDRSLGRRLKDSSTPLILLLLITHSNHN